MDTIIFFHGGPTVQTTNKWDRVISSFLSEGYRVIAPNPQGSIGRGARYAGLDDGEKRHMLIDNEVGPFVEGDDTVGFRIDDLLELRSRPTGAGAVRVRGWPRTADGRAATYSKDARPLRG